uniref:Fumarylacetoacetase-like C-terminal domain-containing protein n=1 Tax=Globisporangium ultimum (strain ATCC 200006 / CBS 805.95 / DAOM BR144) TaxID=431595 RepID=K3X491_GLOUD
MSATAKKFLSLGKKIVAIGKNYEAHAREMGATHAPKDPVIFLKPTTSYVAEGGSVLLPPGIGDVHHEVELGVVIGKGGRDIAEQESMSHVAGYVLAIDMTARHLQDKAKKAGLPWTQAKGFDTFTPVSEFIPKEAVPDPHNLDLWLKVDDELRQDGNTSDMVHKIPFLIAHVSRIMTLEEGDVIITGTPEGVGPVPPNSVMTAGIKGLVDVRFPVETRKYKL